MTGRGGEGCTGRVKHTEDLEGGGGRRSVSKLLVGGVLAAAQEFRLAADGAALGQPAEVVLIRGPGNWQCQRHRLACAVCFLLRKRRRVKVSNEAFRSVHLVEICFGVGNLTTLLLLVRLALRLLSLAPGLVRLLLVVTERPLLLVVLILVFFELGRNIADNCPCMPLVFLLSKGQPCHEMEQNI